jgi:hypothetical protein
MPLFETFIWLILAFEIFLMALQATPIQFEVPNGLMTLEGKGSVAAIQRSTLEP